MTEAESKTLGGVKFDNNKPRYSLLAWKALDEIVRVYTFGAEKYADHNWRRGIKYSRLMSAALRHIVAWNSGETRDPESNLNHLAHAAFSLMAIIEFQKGDDKDLDDREYSDSACINFSPTKKQTDYMEAMQEACRNATRR